MQGLDQTSLPGTNINEFWANGYLLYNQWSHLALTYDLSSKKVQFFINGELDAKVKTDSMWTIDDRKTVVITLDKCVETWWGTVIKGDPEIDTQRVDSTKKVSDYDDETQGAIRKIMFDQHQKHLGLPTSDEMKSNAILEKARYAPGSPFLPPEERNKGLPPPAVE